MSSLTLKHALLRCGSVIKVMAVSSLSCSLGAWSIRVNFASNSKPSVISFQTGPV